MNFEKDNLKWQNLEIKTPNKTILHRESGEITESSLTALLGSSGAGKTTLLNALAGRLQNVQLTGTIKFNGCDRNKRDWPTQVAYVEQFFHAYDNQTVYETILFAAQLKARKSGKSVAHNDNSSAQCREEDQDRIVTNNESFKDFHGSHTDSENRNSAENKEDCLQASGAVEQTVASIINSLGLSHARNTRLCSLSGGEYKRVSIGIELVGNPSILFLDEPTSGLDSFNALNTLIIIKRLAEKGKTVLMTIHQPSYDIIKLFDNVFLLSQGASIFQGNIDGCILYFKGLGFVLPPNTNPCEYFLDLISINPLSEHTIDESQKRIENLQRKWQEKKESDEKQEIRVVVDSKSYNGTLKAHQENHLSPLRTNNSIPAHVSAKDMTECTNMDFSHSILFYIPFFPLFKRNLVELWRDDKYLKIQCIQKIVFTLLVGLTFLQIGYEKQAIQSRTGVIFFVLINTLFGTSGPILNAFPMEKRVIKRERNSGLYDGITAYLSKFTTLLIYNGILSLAYISAVYWMVGLNPNAGKFFIFLIIQLSSVVFAISFGLTIGTLAPSANVAQVLGPTILITYIIYGGNFNNPETIPGWLRWIIWISPVNYAYRASMINQYGGLEFNMGTENMGPGFMGEPIKGEDIVKELGISKPGVWPNVFGLWGLTAAWIIVGSLYLHFSTRIKINIKSGQ